MISTMPALPDLTDSIIGRREAIDDLLTMFNKSLPREHTGLLGMKIIEDPYMPSWMVKFGGLQGQTIILPNEDYRRHLVSQFNGKGWRARLDG